MKAAAHLIMSAPVYVELFVVLQRRFGTAHQKTVEVLISELGIEVIPFDEPQALIAREAYRRFGKGRHPAALNFGDCFSYALAKHLNEPLLFKGEDFRQTDVLVAEI
jgi:ribonuclease VapC